FLVEVSDGNGGTGSATLEITVANVNDAPVFSWDPIIGNDATEDTVYTGSISGSATDEDGDNLTYAKVSGPAWLSMASDGTLDGTPLSSNVGTNVFMVEVFDGNGGFDSASLEITVAALPGPGIRVTEYYLSTGDFSGTTATVTLDQDLAADYYILIRGSKAGDARGYPDNDYARVTGVPGGKGDLPASGATDQITLGRFVADTDWEGVVTVVECENSASADGFKLVDAVETPLTATSGTDTSVSWTDLSRVVLFGGYRGGGAAFTAATGEHNQGAGVYVRLTPSGTGTLNWSRNAAGETLINAVMTTFVVEWGSEWTVQHANVSGASGGNGADATGEYTTEAINAVNRDNTWVWGTGTCQDAGIGDCAEACLVTLGDGVSQHASESTVAVGSEYSDAYDFDVYALTHSAITVDHRFKADGDAVGPDVAVTVDNAAAGARFGWVYNGCNGTGSHHPRSRFWARYTADGTVTVSRGYDGQAFPAWVQGVDFSGLNQ
ncbi:Ig-like domain-containing protein, partial [Pontiellaceae bacterium B12227]|nr:Ig-like domain-containing protein [Pontiellaceae bacterium B12227]